ncbi:MAG: translation elongation factor Ts [Candidatus Pacebacteria bacterium]|nr:translation elongation factor Ts [Candidatus Paceibacterota bacterium]
MEISVDQIKALREETGVSIGKCKQALVDAGGDMDKAKELIREISAKAAAKKADRDLGAGIIESYIHSNKTIGVLIKLACETDYVARNEDFINLAGDIAMHIAAMGTESVEELADQPFVKNPEITISKLIEEAVLKIGERIEVAEFSRFSI